MSKRTKSWSLVPAETELREQLSKCLGISSVVAQLLINRGICDEREARNFLFAGTEMLGNPYEMKDMREAVQRIVTAIETQEKITIYGDYDVDGITACAVLYKLLSNLGANADYYIPERQSEGYGLNDDALAQLAAGGTGLVITVDCGIGSVEEIATMLGKMDIIITDHHQPPETLPAAFAIVNPKRKDCTYPDKNLAGVGVVFKLCQALWMNVCPDSDPFLHNLDLVALGTIADIVPLIGENRFLVKLGLEQLTKTKNVGLQSLVEVCGLKNAKMDTEKVGFTLAPRLNAAGRVSRAAIAVELLVTSDYERAKYVAKLLDEENSQRQAIEKQILETANQLIKDTGLLNDRVLIVAGENWHPGVIGIVASRLVDRYYRPVIVISTKGGIGKGSCRSIPGFDMYEALSSCKDLLVKFGGHKQAAGLTISIDRLEEFRKRMCGQAELLSEEDCMPKLRIDTLLSLEQINSALMEQLACLAPHGMGNPAPVFACCGLRVADLRPVGREGKHLKLKVKRQNITGDVIAWGMGEMAAVLKRDENIDIAFAPEFNEWQGQRSIQLKALDVRKINDNI